MQALPTVLLASGSLTKKLRAAAQDFFSVDVIFEGFVLTHPKQYPLLSLSAKQFVWCRRVALLVDDVVWIQAQTMIPCSSLKGAARRLLYLKQRPLGELLFSDPHLRRSKFHIQPSDTASRAATFTRTSIFHFKDQPIVLTETFLPCALRHFGLY